MTTLLICVDCGAEIDKVEGGGAKVGSLCRKCIIRLNRELEPQGFPRRTLLRQDGLRRWRNKCA